MFKKIFCLALALVMMMSIAAVGFSAAQVEVAEVAADADAATTGADAEVASTGLDTSKCLNFDTTTAGWSDFGKIGFYICNVDGTEWKPWGNKSLFKSEDSGNGIWSFDPEANGVGLQDGEQYYVIFVNQNSGGQTANLIFDTSCLGDTAYCDGTTQENDVDSNKSSAVARWRNSSYGPMKVITSIGNVVGETIPKNKTAYSMLVNFLASGGKDGLQNALNFKPGETAQSIIDSVAGNLGLTQADVTKAIKEAAETGNPDTGDKKDWSKDWDASKSTLPKGDSGSDSSSTSGSNSSSGSSSSSSGSSSSSSGSSSSSSSKSGSASNTQTGQTEDMIFIMLGVMVVAAGVIFFARKRSRA